MIVWAAVRSLLFVPADDARKVERALTSAADAVILDLEDGVAPTAKPLAREAAGRILEGERDKPILVRINDPRTHDGTEDLRIPSLDRADAIVVPKCEPASLKRIESRSLALVALVETPAGLLSLAEIAEHPQVVALQLGAEDLAAELGLRQALNDAQLALPRGLLVLHAAAVGLPAPIDAVATRWDRPEELRVGCEVGRALGMGAKACIHPDQLDVVNAVFAPTADEVLWARRVMAAHSEALLAGAGASQLDGAMVDEAVVRRARGIVAGESTKAPHD